MSPIKSTLLLVLLTCMNAEARPRHIREVSGDVEVDTSVTNLSAAASVAESLNSMTSGLATVITSAAPSFTPSLTFATLSYVAYVASTMFVPSALTAIGVPPLEDFSMASRSSRTSNSIVDSLASGFVADVISRTDTAGALKATGGTVMINSISTIKNATKAASRQVHDIHGRIGTVIKALSPECLSRYMCQAGQFTSVSFPILGSMLRSIDSEHLDDYARALIDGTTIGDCSAVFHECEL